MQNKLDYQQWTNETNTKIYFWVVFSFHLTSHCHVTLLLKAPWLPQQHMISLSINTPAYLVCLKCQNYHFLQVRSNKHIKTSTHTHSFHCHSLKALNRSSSVATSTRICYPGQASPSWHCFMIEGHGGTHGWYKLLPQKRIPGWKSSVHFSSTTLPPFRCAADVLQLTQPCVLHFHFRHLSGMNLDQNIGIALVLPSC